MEVLNWVVNNWTTLLKLYAAIVGVASIVIKLTPTLKDDHALKGFLKFTGKYLALNRK